MDIIQKIDAWLDSKRAPVWMDIVRIVLGLFIIYKGYEFTSNFELLTQEVGSVGMAFMAAHVAHYVIFVHLVGGILLALGAFTRSMCILNLPILIGAVIFNYEHFNTVEKMGLPTAVIVLLMLVMITIYGSGKYSLNAIRKKRSHSPQTS
ncbi:MAG: DoxX family protein [Cyclobacteriaceae bacterium]